ncbi:MAG: phosphoribosylanthranilate isomerase [Verrucomicrobiota bacterium]
MAMQIKICGVTNSRDALACAAAGVDMIGLNFCERSPRYIGPDQARTIARALPSSTRAVGIFVNAPVEELRRLAHDVGLRILQLHGSESPEMCAELARDFEVIKALRIDARFAAQKASAYPSCTILLDSYDEEMAGGTGEVGDWKVARETRKFATRLILAGGLNPENVAEAIATVNPDGVDVCSSLESTPGVKDLGRVHRFVAAARNAEKVGAARPS